MGSDEPPSRHTLSSVSDEVFVVMQIGEKGSAERRRADEVYEFVLVPVLEELSLSAYRADLDPTPGNITPQLLTKLLEARFVIADLTGRNPNVFYELGIAHAFERPLVSLAASAKDLPFDASDERVIELGAQVGESLTMAQGERAKQQLRASLAVVLADDYKPRSPLTAVATGRRIDDLSPSDPIAADLALMREGLEELRARPVPMSVDLEGVMSLRHFVEGLVDAGRLSENEVSGMVNGATGRSFDAWVDSLAARLRAASGPAVLDNDPWSSAPAPTMSRTGSWSVEPPF